MPPCPAATRAFALQAQADVNVQNRFGWTALGVCVFTALLPGQPEPSAEHEDSVCRVLEDLLQVKASACGAFVTSVVIVGAGQGRR